MATREGDRLAKVPWQWAGVLLYLVVVILFVVPPGHDRSDPEVDIACNAVVEGILPVLYADSPGEHTYEEDGSEVCAARRTGIVGLGALLLVPATVGFVLGLRLMLSDGPERSEPSDNPDDQA